MKGTPTSGPVRRPAQEVGSSAWLDCDADLRLSLKTRRAVRDEVISAHDRRMSQRRSVGLALVGFFAMLVLFAPALWDGLEYLLAEDHLFEWTTQVVFLMLVLFTAMLAALIAVWGGQCDIQHDRRGFETFRPFDK